MSEKPAWAQNPNRPPIPPWASAGEAAKIRREWEKENTRAEMSDRGNQCAKTRDGRRCLSNEGHVGSHNYARVHAGWGEGPGARAIRLQAQRDYWRSAALDLADSYASPRVYARLVEWEPR